MSVCSDVTLRDARFYLVLLFGLTSSIFWILSSRTSNSLTNLIAAVFSGLAILSNSLNNNWNNRLSWVITPIVKYVRKFCSMFETNTIKK